MRLDSDTPPHPVSSVCGYSETMNVITDHRNKPSQGRVTAIASSLAGIMYALAPVGYEMATGSVMATAVHWPVFATLMLGPNGILLWQKISAPQEAKSD